MRKIVFLFTIAMFMFGCTDQESSAPEAIVFTLFNETDQEIRILAFDTQDETSGEIYDEPIAADEIRIEANSSYSITRYASLEEALLKAFYSIEDVDYVRIIFNDERIKDYILEEARDTPDFNIFKGDASCQHFITQEDYNTANICISGNCD